MPEFIGRYVHTVDDKGRLSIPADFRADLAGGLVLAQGWECCLTLYPEAVWRALAQRAANLPLTDPDARAVRRIMFSQAARCRLDPQGRIAVPSLLRQYAQMKNEVYVLGANEYLEIWAKDVWDQEEANQRERSNTVAQRQTDFTL